MESLDPLVRNRMDDWGDLLTCEGVISPSQGGKAPAELEDGEGSLPLELNTCGVLGLDDATSKRRILSLWFRQVVNGKRIFYPSSAKQVWFYSVHDSDVVKFIFELTTCFFIVLPALYTPYCAVRRDQTLANPPAERQRLLSDEGLTALVILGCIIESIDMYFQCSSSTWEDFWGANKLMKFDNSRFWKMTKIVTLFLVLVDGVAFFGDRRNPFVMRSLFPILFIVRRENIQHLFEGTYFAVRKSANIYRVVLITIILWAFAGYCLFNRLESSDTSTTIHFDTYWLSLYTCFRCYLSRPSALWILRSYFDLNQASALFFVTLTLVADIFGTSLIIATGARHFRDFSLLCFRYQLKHRRTGLLAIFYLLEDLQRAGQVGEKIAIGELAGEDKNLSSELSCNTWLFFCSCLRERFAWSTKDMLTLYALESPKLGPITKLQFFKLCGALASQPVFAKSLPVSDIFVAGQSSFNPLATTAFTSPEKESIALRVSFAVGTEDVLNLNNDEQLSVLDIRSKAQFAFQFVTNKLVSAFSTEEQRDFLVKSADALAHYGLKIEFSESPIGKVLKIFGLKTRIKFKPFSLLSVCVHAVLIYQLTAVSDRDPRTGTIELSWVLLFFFSFENAVHYLAGSEDRATTVRDTCINFLVFVTMCVLGSDTENLGGTALTLYIICQSLRSMKLFSVLKGAQALYSILSVVWRAFLLIGFVVYFFAVFGHVFFCGAFDTAASLGADDDATAWVRYAEFLNFDSFLSSCYTLSQVIVVSNWSMVMDAALVVFPIRSFFFFYSFKALMTLAVVPLMTSLIIQAFIAQFSRKTVDSIREKMKVYTISSEIIFSSSMVAMWSPNGRETIVGQSDGGMAESEKATRCDQIEILRTEIRTKKRLIQEALLKERFVKSHGALAPPKRLSNTSLPVVDEIPKNGGEDSHDTQKGLLKWVETEIEVLDLRIVNEMKEWESLLTDNSLRPVGVHEKKLYDLISKNWSLPREHYSALAYLWYHDSIHARHIDLPRNKISLMLYSTHRSKWFLNLCNILVVLQITSTLFVSSPCPRGDSFFSTTDSELRLCFAVINLLIAIFYGSETVTNLYLGGQGGNGTKARLFCCLFVAIDTLVFLGGNKRRSLPSSAIFPLFWVTRSNTFREVVMGLSSSLRRSAPVYSLLFAFLIVWSLMGFYLFHRFDTPLGQFATFGQTMKTVLHCFTAAPFALDALLPLYTLSHTTVLYFLVITLTMEILTVSLVVATADMEFRHFAAGNLKRRLSLRRDALLAIWSLYSIDGYLHEEQWLDLCKGMRGLFTIDAASASIFFLFATNQGVGATQAQFFSLMGLIHSRSKAVSDPPVDRSREIGLRSASDVELTNIYGRADFRKHRNNSGANPHHPALIQIAISQKKQSGVSESERNNVLTALRLFCRNLVFSDLAVLCNYRVLCLDAISFVLHVLLIPQIINIGVNLPSSTLSSVKSWVQFGWFLEACFWIEMFVRIVALGEIAFMRRESYIARALINVTSLVCMWMLGLSTSKSSPVLDVLVFVQCSRLFLLFWVEQGASAISKILKVAARCLFLLFSVIFFFSIYAQNSFCNAIDPARVEAARIVETPSGPELATDDSYAWVNFQDILNFESYLQSMYTLFEVAVLGSWSMIMDAAAKSDSVKAFGFFYPFRLAIILAVLPLLNGLVIRSYVLIMDQSEKLDSFKANERDMRRIANDFDDFDDDDDDYSTVAFAETRETLAKRRDSQIARKSYKARATAAASKAGRTIRSDSVVSRLWRGLTSVSGATNVTTAEERIKNHLSDAHRISRNSFLSFWATGSGNSDGTTCPAPLEDQALIHENLAAENARITQIMARLGMSEKE